MWVTGNVINVFTHPPTEGLENAEACACSRIRISTLRAENALITGIRDAMSRQRCLPAQVAVVVRNQGTEGFRFVLRQPNCYSLSSIHGILNTRFHEKRNREMSKLCPGTLSKYSVLPRALVILQQVCTMYIFWLGMMRKDINRGP